MRKNIVRSIKRMISGLAYISRHPLTQGHLFSAYYRYFGFHIIQLFRRKKPQKYHFISGIYFYASLGEGGIAPNIYTGLADFQEMSFLLHFLNNEDLFVDIGANVGAYSLLASGVCGSKSIAVEPIPVTFKRLVENVKLNALDGAIDCRNVGIGSVEATLNFVETKYSSWNHVAADNEASNDFKIPIRVLPLDTVVSNVGVPAMLKVDVEGYEMEVLKGANHCLQDARCKAIIIELNGSGEKYGFKDEEIYSFLIEKGFNAYHYEPISRNLNRLNGRKKENMNVIFVRDLDLVSEKIMAAPKRKILSHWI